MFLAMTGKRLAAFAAGLLILSAGVADVSARVATDPIPDPRPRPAYAPAPSATTQAAVRQPSRSGNLLADITRYFNSFRTMQGSFIQFGPHGEQSEGTFYMSRPGKIRFQYNPPVKLDVIADGRNVAVRNTRTATQDYYPLGKTPLRYLISDRIDLSGVVSEVREENDLIALIIVEDSRLVKGKLTLIFDRNTLELKQWIITDGRGLNTSVAIYNTTTGNRLDPSLFKINYY